MKLFKTLLNTILSARARKIFFWLKACLPYHGSLLDIGSGTGHNGREIKRRMGLALTELDLTDMSMTGTPPLLYDGKHIPFPDKSHDCSTMIFVLQYVADPYTFLKEVKRITTGNIIVLQTVYQTPLSGYLLKVYEFLMGRLPYYLFKMLSIFPNAICTLKPARQYSASQLEDLFTTTGLVITLNKNKGLNLFGITHKLYILNESR